MGNTQSVTAEQPTRRKLTPAQETTVLEESAKGVKREVLAVRFDVHPNTILNVLRRLDDKKGAPDRHPEAPSDHTEVQSSCATHAAIVPATATLDL
ncbi:hypothetical protein EON81_25805 [bacterium]|nr:MAG: hypothetical protein EON81_25805 [bacterium]